MGTTFVFNWPYQCAIYIKCQHILVRIQTPAFQAPLSAIFLVDLGNIVKSCFTHVYRASLYNNDRLSDLGAHFDAMRSMAACKG